MSCWPRPRREATTNSDAAFCRISFLCSLQALQTKKQTKNTHRWPGGFLSVGALYPILSEKSTHMSQDCLNSKPSEIAVVLTFFF